MKFSAPADGREQFISTKCVQESILKTDRSAKGDSVLLFCYLETVT
jgi:hypothetical protein